MFPLKLTFHVIKITYNLLKVVVIKQEVIQLDI